jgi:hypothetical protein
MRVSFLATLPLLGALAVTPQKSSAQVSVSLHLGKPVVVTSYTPEAYGDWHNSYRSWSPTTLYYYDGNWYPRQVHGSRAVAVYRSNGHYFLPPREQINGHVDRRYNAKRGPQDDDYNHLAPPPPPRSRPQGH